MAGVFKRPDSDVWWLRWSFGGKQYRRSSKTTSRRAAEAMLARVKLEIHNGQFFPEQRETELSFGSLAEKWTKHAAIHKRSANSDKARLERLVTFFGEDRSVATILPRDVQELTEALAEETTKRGGKMSPATINRHLELLRAMLHLAEKDGFWVRAAEVALIPVRNQRERIITEAEFKRLTEAASPMLRLVIELGWWSAMRLGEILSLRWDQIDLKGRVVRLGQKDTKAARARLVPLPQQAADALEAWPRRLDGWVFGPKVKSSSVSPLFSRLVRELGIEDAHFHDLRHSRATALRRSGADLVTIAAVLGHSTMAMTARYQVVNEADLREAADRAAKPRAKGRKR